MIDDIIKRKDELRMVAPLLEELGYKPNLNMCGERLNVRPDIFLPSIDNRRIGIEVTEYVTKKRKKAEKSLYRVFKKYEKIFYAKQNNRHGFITVEIKEDKDPYELNYREIESQLFKELDSFLFPNNCFVNYMYLKNAIFHELSNASLTKVHLGAECYFADTINEPLLIERIKDKELKLKAYRQIPDNRTIEEYWLAIYASFIEHPENRYYKLPDNFETQYSRIYLIDDAYCKQIK